MKRILIVWPSGNVLDIGRQYLGLSDDEGEAEFELYVAKLADLNPDLIVTVVE